MIWRFILRSDFSNTLTKEDFGGLAGMHLAGEEKFSAISIDRYT